MFCEIEYNLPDNNTEVLVMLDDKKSGICTGAKYFSETGFRPIGIRCEYGCSVEFDGRVVAWASLDNVTA